jgi:integrase/recombinase XerD
LHGGSIIHQVGQTGTDKREQQLAGQATNVTHPAALYSHAPFSPGHGYRNDTAVPGTRHVGNNPNIHPYFKRGVMNHEDEFTKYRLKNNYSEKTIKTQDHHVKTFLNWCIKQYINPGNINYNEALQFIDHERNRDISSASVNRTINSIKIYLDYLVYNKATRHNIIRQIKLRYEGKKALPELLTTRQLETIYKDFSKVPRWRYKTTRETLLNQRNTIILGLLVYQGLDSGEIAKLERAHVNLKEGNIYIPSTRRSNARTLKLQSDQVLPFKNYIEETRPGLLKKQTDQTPYLFPAKKYSDTICKVVAQARKMNPELKDSRQIRASVIMNWLKTNNIRQVQYMAGHKSIKSTESYRKQDLTDLTRQLELYHPLK